MNFKTSLSARLYLLIIVGVFAGYVVSQWKYPEREAIRSDGYSYYVFLPAAFIYHDLTMGFNDALPDSIRSKTGLAYYAGRSYHIPKMTAGVATLMMPFFLAGHVTAQMTGVAANGYTRPYQLAISFAAIFYFLAGLFFIRKALLHFFSELVTAVVIVVPFFLTNLINYTIWEQSMSHVYSFFLVAVMLYCTVAWHRDFKTKYFVALLFVMGMITLVRPTNLSCAIVPLLYGIGDKEIRKMKFQAAFRPLALTFGIILFLLPVLMQLALWKHQSGSWFVDSYFGEHFYFNNPHISAVLVGFRSGWLIYTPVMIFAVIGIVTLLKSRSPLGWGVLIFFLVNLYVTSSWWCYWYGGTFGMRPFTDFYPIFLFPLAAALKNLLEHKSSCKWTLTLLAFFGLLNMLQEFQFQRNILHYSNMSPRAYAGIFGRISRPSNYEDLLDPDDIEMAMQGKPMRNELKPTDIGSRIVASLNVTIKANGKFASADGNFKSLVADREFAYQWEIFHLVKTEDNHCLIRTWNQLYLCTDDSGNLAGIKFAQKERAIFEMIPRGNNQYILKAPNGKYLALDGSPAPLLKAMAVDAKHAVLLTITVTENLL
jgi:hypothetical protein